MTANRIDTAPLGLDDAIQRLRRRSADQAAERTLDEGLDITRDAAWADASALFVLRDGAFDEVARRPNTPWPLARGVPETWFPWGLSPVNPQRFLLISDARLLPALPGSQLTLGDLDVRSVLHLPLHAQGRRVGALQMYWSEPRLAWDDERGPLLRLLGRFLLDGVGRL